MGVLMDLKEKKFPDINPDGANVEVVFRRGQPG